MNVGLIKAALSIIERLIRPIMLAIGLWKVRESGKEAAEKEALENELKAADNARAADRALDSDERVRSEFEEWRERRSQR